MSGNGFNSETDAISSDASDRRGKLVFSPVSGASRAAAEPQKSGALPSCVFLNTYYPGFLNAFYRRNPALTTASYNEQNAALTAEQFGDSDFYSSGLRKAGWATQDLIINCAPLQAEWAKEHGIDASGDALICEQIRYLRPDVVYCQDIYCMSEPLLKAIRRFTKLIIGQNAAQIDSLPFHLYDAVFSSHLSHVDSIRADGIAAFYTPLAFDPRIHATVKVLPFEQRQTQCSFIGTIGADHTQRSDLLLNAVAKTPLEIWGQGCELLPGDSPIRGRHCGEAWGREMFSVLANSKITLNLHADYKFKWTGPVRYANNMRLYEATGCGALLITDYKENLNRLFEIGSEIVAYRSIEEACALVKYFILNPSQAQAIAKAGMERTLRDHTYEKRLECTAEALARLLRYRDQNETIIDLGKSSPDRVHSSPKDLYYGKPATGHTTLAELLKKPLADAPSVLEIGCGDGRHFEVLEYLLNMRLEYIGTESCAETIAAARKNYPHAKFMVATNEQLPFAARQFPAVVSSAAPTGNSDYTAHIKELARVAARWIVCHELPVAAVRSAQDIAIDPCGHKDADLRLSAETLVSEFAANGFRLDRSDVIDSQRDRKIATFLFERSTDAPKSIPEKEASSAQQAFDPVDLLV